MTKKKRCADLHEMSVLRVEKKDEKKDAPKDALRGVLKNASIF